MTKYFFSRLTAWITSSKIAPRRSSSDTGLAALTSRTRRPLPSIQRPASSVQYLASGLYFLQTPVFRGEREDPLGDAKQVAISLLRSDKFFLAILGICIAIGLLVLYRRKKGIPELEIQVAQDDTWFTTRDDNNRIGIVVSVNLVNRSTRGIYITDCRLSGYSAREGPEEIHLEGREEKKKLDFPEHEHLYRGKEFYLGAYSSETLWFYYESRAVTMKNVLEAPLTIRDSSKRRKSTRVKIPRHADQIAMYTEMAKMW